LVENLASEKVVSFQGCQVTGMTAGVWCPNGDSFGLPIDQRVDDGLSLCFTSAPLDQAVEILGFPEVKLKVAFDQANALLSARLCDVAPDGFSRLVSWGLLNLHTGRSRDPGTPYTW
jgi:predicted acyl esterase